QHKAPVRVRLPSGHFLHNAYDAPNSNPRGRAHGKEPETVEQGQITGGATPVPQPPGATERRQRQLSPRSLPVRPLGGFTPSGSLKSQAIQSVLMSATDDLSRSGACFTPSSPFYCQES